MLCHMMFIETTEGRVSKWFASNSTHSWTMIPIRLVPQSRQRIGGCYSRIRCLASSSKANQGPASTTRIDWHNPTLVTGLALSTGFILGRVSASQQQQQQQQQDQGRVLPSGLPRTCCDQDKHKYTQEQLDLPQRLAEIVVGWTTANDNHCTLLERCSFGRRRQGSSHCQASNAQTSRAVLPSHCGRRLCGSVQHGSHGWVRRTATVGTTAIIIVTIG